MPAPKPSLISQLVLCTWESGTVGPVFSRNNSSTCNNFGGRRQLLLRKLLQKAWVEEMYKKSANAFCAKKFSSLSRTAGVIQPVRVKNKGVLLLLCPFALREASAEAGCRATWPAFPQMHWHEASAMINCSQSDWHLGLNTSHLKSLGMIVRDDVRRCNSIFSSGVTPSPSRRGCSPDHQSHLRSPTF